MNQADWRSQRAIENKFLERLYKLTDVFMELALSSGGNLDTFQESMYSFQNSPEYLQYLYRAVKNMVTPLSVQNMRTWREASKAATRSREIYSLIVRELRGDMGNAVDTIVRSNALLIKTLPTDVAQKVTRDVADYAYKGMRATEVAKIISKYTDQHSRASARLIARTEVSKATTALTRVRAESIGSQWYVWRTAHDGDRVRKSHREMYMVLVNWNDPPSPERLVGEKDVGAYHAGDIWNCRCYPEPLLHLGQVKWPAKVHQSGRLETMSKAQFEKIGGKMYL